MNLYSNFMANTPKKWKLAKLGFILLGIVAAPVLPMIGATAAVTGTVLMVTSLGAFFCGTAVEKGVVGAIEDTLEKLPVTK